MTDVLNTDLISLGELMASNLNVQGVTASASDGLTTLAGKILDINGTTPTGTFTDLQNLIDNATAGDTIILNKDYKYDSIADSGLTSTTSKINITKALTIEGNGHIIDGNNQVKLLRISASGATVNLFNLTLQNALAPSNQNAGALQIYQSTVNIYNTNFVNNNGTLNGMGIFSGVANSYPVTITNCSFVGNTSSSGQGGAILISSGTWTIKNCIFKNNSANTYADIYSYNPLTVYDCDITNINTTCYNVTNVE